MTELLLNVIYTMYTYILMYMYVNIVQAVMHVVWYTELQFRIRRDELNYVLRLGFPSFLHSATVPPYPGEVLSFSLCPCSFFLFRDEYSAIHPGALTIVPRHASVMEESLPLPALRSLSIRASQCLVRRYDNAR